MYDQVEIPTDELDGRIHDGHFSYTAGGVARNICEALCILGYPPHFITAIGNDEPGRLLKSFIPHESSHLLNIIKDNNTAQCIIVFDNKGDCKFLMGDMGIHQQITPEIIRSYEDVIRTTPLIILDGNLSIEAIGEILRLAEKYSIPALYEPTDIEIAAKPFETPYWKALKFITPNVDELKYIASFLNISPNNTFVNKIEEAVILARELVVKVENVIVTLGSGGVLICRKGLATDPFIKHNKKDKICVRHYSGTVIENLVNVSGAGDCLASGIVSGILSGLSEEDCVSIGFRAAQASLHSNSAVPKDILNWRNTLRRPSNTNVYTTM